ncbi:MAG TPA: DUF4139 domain-containing protein [Bryobacteraceae bacterium]|nr:DUF4139 domain-containing protein [Bryobacteraceae bacterium]
MQTYGVTRMSGRLAALCICATALVSGADPALTIYNQNFAVVRETLPLDLKAGNNTVRFSGVTAQVEPDSVILRDPAGKWPLRVLEQNYRNDAVSQERLLSLYEGKTIEFAVRNPDGSDRIVSGKIVRSGYAPPPPTIWPNRAAYQLYNSGMTPGLGQPVIEVGGKLQFMLPGQPIFPALGGDTILKPALDWILYSTQPARFAAELSYVSGGMSWSSDYNIVAPETGDTLDLVGWVTLDNQSGRQFDQARIKLMAGDVNKVVQRQNPYVVSASLGAGSGGGFGPGQVEEKTFEDYHLYTLPQPTTLHDRETKQIEFLRASGIQSKRLYVYDGAKFDRNFANYQDVRQIQQYGTQSNPRVWVMREFVNSDANHLGVPLPKGRVRFYRRDNDGQVEFTGENQIDHTPKDETVRVYTGNAFDLTGERRQTKFQSQLQPGGWLDESFEIKLRNHKKEAATVRIVEHLYRWSNWVITQESAPHRQTDSKTVEYEVTLDPGAEKTLTYTAHYTW